MMMMMNLGIIIVERRANGVEAHVVCMYVCMYDVLSIFFRNR